MFCITGGDFCSGVDKAWTMDLWQENHILATGVITWEEALATQPSPDAFYQGDVIKCIQANFQEPEENGETRS